MSDHIDDGAYSEAFPEERTGPATAQIIDAADMFSNWRTKLILNDAKKPKAILANVLTAFRHSPDWKGVLRYDAFRNCITLVLPPPWVRDRSDWKPVPWLDVHETLAAEWCQRQGIIVNQGVVGPSVSAVAQEDPFNPLTDYLDGLTWDCEERLDSLLPALFGAEVTPYTSTVFRCMALSAVARASQPGCKVDTVLTIEGRQGKRKSSGLKALFGEEFFTDDLAELGTKDAAMQVAGVWCVEIAELAAMKRADQDKLKAFLSRQKDRLRLPYGRNVVEQLRSSIFISTTNLDDWAKDETGGRRYWPVTCSGRVDTDGIACLRDQIWAEAVARYRSGEDWWITDPAIIKQAEAEVADRYVGDVWDDLIAQAVDGRSSVTIAELLTDTIQIEPARQGKPEQMRVGSILKHLGWRRDKITRGGKRVRGYLPPKEGDDQ